MAQSNLADTPVSRHPIADLEVYDVLAELALDVSLTWKHETDGIWRQINQKLWEDTRNPWVVLHAASRDRLQSLMVDPAFKQKLDDRLMAKTQAKESATWFEQTHSGSGLSSVAYFSMEYMLSEALPIYSGGLGNVAGDLLKAASDLGVPVIGIGLLYQQGYFRQTIDRDGTQQELYPYNDPGQLPIAPLRTADGEWLRLEVVLPAYSVWLRAWQVRVGSVTLYLLDTNDAANFPAHRGITSELYGGGPELRLRQEMVLGIGGWRLLEALGLQPEVCHLNEGHAAFAILERARSFMEKSGQPFEAALAATRAGNLFTTHTAVPAGFDRFPPALIERYLSHYAGRLGISLHDLLALGRRDPNDPAEDFNMAYLAIRGSGAVNGVSRLHGQVSRSLFSPLFPRWPVGEVPVTHVTNGIHAPTWESTAADQIWADACGNDRWRATPADLEQGCRRMSDARLWEMRTASRLRFIDYVRARYSRQLAAGGESPEAVDRAKHAFDLDTLTLGFARRFATYKRPNLLLSDPERLIRLLTDPKHPIRLVLAGKAHPADQTGQDLIQQWFRFLQRPEVRGRAVFLSDYDMLLAEQMVAGVDVWLNTPLRPWEACGTSGMKVLVNGGINLSELDGWWAEAHAPEVGWSLGDGEEHGDDGAQTKIDADALYGLLEREVIPEFYRRDSSGLPVEWTARMRESMCRLTPQFSAGRMLQQYTEQHYLPAASAYRKTSDDRGAVGSQILDWRRNLEQKWPGLRFGEIRVEAAGDLHKFETEVFLSSIDPDAVRVELYADEVGGKGAALVEMERGQALDGGFVYRASAPANRPATDYTARVIPRHLCAAIPLECSFILWQR